MRRESNENAEWDFSSISKDESANAWRWEIFREFERAYPGFAFKRMDPVIVRFIKQNRLLLKPFLSLDSELKSKLFLTRVQKMPAFCEVSFERAPKTKDTIAGEEMILRLTCCGTYVIQIAWDQPKTTIVREFAKWVEANRDSKQTGAAFANFVQGSESKIDARTWLKDLAIYRVAIAGITSTDAKRILSWISQTRTSGFSRPHFSDARKATIDTCIIQ